MNISDSIIAIAIIISLAACIYAFDYFKRRKQAEQAAMRCLGLRSSPSVEASRHIF